jgi:hypothetical protein
MQHPATSRNVVSRATFTVPCASALVVATPSVYWTALGACPDGGEGNLMKLTLP